MCASARGSASSIGASMTSKCRTVRVEELSFEVIGRRVVGSVWLSNSWYCIVFGESHLYINKPSAKRRASSQYRLDLIFPLLSRFEARRQSVRSVEFWSSASKFEGCSKRFERHVVVRSSHQVPFSLVHPVELSLARTLPSLHRPPPPPPTTSFLERSSSLHRKASPPQLGLGLSFV